MADHDARLHIPLTRKMKEQLKALADEEGRSMSEVARRALQDRLEQAELARAA